MNIDKIIHQLGISSYVSYNKIVGGRDSSVFKINVQDRASYALRVLPFDRYQQFIQEKKIIELAGDNGVPVPIVNSIITYEGYAAMLMEWVSGKTILAELQQRPGNAKKIGFEFGRVQATIHKISPNDDSGTSPWFVPQGDEKEIFTKLSYPSLKNNCLLHLDFHPLNVLTDGEKITGVIDWLNASTGDSRFDFARTLSILQLEANKYVDSSVVNTFEEGWQAGYESTFGKVKFLPLFNVWAGLRLKRDLAGALLPEDIVRIDKWVERWRSNY
ncbi:phosphotransferase family protein [Virgibacillus ndiopensis]|uniref:phosphotransferase family protein n=1 Tax=Virgibacillus ndiopensis TaxID=2004408 RepID=UPI00159BE1E1|nr:phosphotransferase [Virgibacillus ndiopensis]